MPTRKQGVPPCLPRKTGKDHDLSPSSVISAILLKPLCRSACLLRETRLSFEDYGSCPERAQRARESGDFDAVSEFCRAFKMEKSPTVSRTRRFYFNGRTLARRPGEHITRIDAGTPALPGGTRVFHRGAILRDRFRFPIKGSLRWGAKLEPVQLSNLTRTGRMAWSSAPRIRQPGSGQRPLSFHNR